MKIWQGFPTNSCHQEVETCSAKSSKDARMLGAACLTPQTETEETHMTSNFDIQGHLLF